MRLAKYLESTTTNNIEKNLAKGHVDIIGMAKRKKKKNKLTGIDIIIHELNEGDIKNGLKHLIQSVFSKSDDIRLNQIWMKAKEITKKLKRKNFDVAFNQLLDDGFLIKKSGNIYKIA